MTDLLAPSEFSVSAEAHDGEMVVSVRGEIDVRTAPELALAITDAVALHPYALLVDLTAVTFMDSSACHCLIQAQRAANKASVALELSGVDGPKFLVLQILGLDKLFTLRPT